MKSNSSELLRHQNRAKVLETLRKSGPASHTDIADSVGMSSSTVSVVTAELEDELVLRRVEPDDNQPPGRGRPRVLLELNPGCAYIATLRMTARSIEFSLVDYAGTLKDRFTVARDITDSDENSLATAVKSNLLKLVDRIAVDKNDIHTISITTKGLVAENRPVLLWSPVLGENQIDFESLLSPDWQARVLLSNETCFSSLAVADRAQQGNVTTLSRRHLVLSIEDSIGIGIAIRGKQGRYTSIAPPFGHIIHQLDGPLCRCGSFGCIEALAGYYGILRTAFNVPTDTIPARFIPHEEMSRLADSARRGDHQSGYAFRIAGETLGAEVSRLQSIFGLMPMTITGSGAAFFDLMQEGFSKYLRSNLLVRFNELPAISVIFDEAELIFEGNARSTLRNLDEDIVATRRLSRQKYA